ncbi:hypothetical protein THAOC_12094 [Thalassiosira oceanica]|uniref:Uncharacterized protein n=1 Tax=Thalassiosira oceanica TaxID=159749 RepID=K0T8S6_THAOC|nr:hypothetical protein THAOC_12094 [Thalassiosira oceanica]|eukprot:EJK66932.1 hypothetical protein THAOC_12094 [Thalassiosira oceanica]
MLQRSTLQAPTRVGGRAASLTGCELDVAVKSAAALDVKWGGWWERAGDSAARVPLTTRSDPAKRLLSPFTAFAAVSNKHNENLRRVREGAAQGVLQWQAVEDQEEPAETVCNGCELEAGKSGIGCDCPFCRTPAPQSDEASLDMIQKRVEAMILWPSIISALATWMETTDWQRTYQGLSSYLNKPLSSFAAKQGDVIARCNLGSYENDSGNYGLVRKHLMISAKLGDKESLDEIKGMFMEGMVSKADYADALRGYHDAAKEMSSPERDEAKNGG